MKKSLFEVCFAIFISSTLVSSANGLSLSLPFDYERKAPVKLLVNALTSPSTLIPYDFYHEKFHFCTPEKPEHIGESIGSILLGDRLYSSNINISMLEDEACAVWCNSAVPAKHAKFINQRIKENYRINWMIDSLPGSQRGIDREDGTPTYNVGFLLGSLDKNEKPLLHNHYELEISYHETSAKFYRVVGVAVKPFSVTRSPKNPCEIVGSEPTKLSEKDNNDVTYTYSIHWEKSDLSWATRWDVYSSGFDSHIHWFSITNSFIITLFLSGMIAVIVMRALNHDIARYNLEEIEDGTSEDYGWKLVHADVFRTPKYRMLLGVLVGNGVQLFAMIAISILLAGLGFFSLSNRGSLSTVMLVFYVLFSGVGGYVSARLYKMMGGVQVRRNISVTAFALPGALFTIFIVLNFFLIATESSSAIPFGTLAAIGCLWVLISAPLSIVGALIGNNSKMIEFPCKTNQIPRQVPQQPFFLNEVITLFAGGILPFGVVFIELYFILNSLWFNRVYFMFGFLFLVLVIVIITSAEVAILLCYTQLCSEDYRWPWRSFRTVGMSGLYIFGFGLFYGIKRIAPESTASFALFIGWSGIVSFMFALFTGSIGYLACLYFVRKIFASIKID